MQEGVALQHPVDHPDAALRQDLAQVIIGAAVAEAKIDHVALEIGDLFGGPVQPVALRGQAAQHGIQSAHVMSFGSVGAVQRVTGPARRRVSRARVKSQIAASCTRWWVSTP